MSEHLRSSAAGWPLIAAGAQDTRVAGAVDGEGGVERQRDRQATRRRERGCGRGVTRPRPTTDLRGTTKPSRPKSGAPVVRRPVVADRLDV
jgi:hypothetical protein